MTRNLFIMLAAFAMAITLSGCKSCKSSTEDNTETSKDVKVSYFNKLDIDGVANIYFTQGDKPSVKIVGNKKYVNKTIIKQENETLEIDTKVTSVSGLNFSGRKKLDIYITSPDLIEIESDGVGNIRINNKLDTDILKIESDGVGNIHIDDLTCDNIKIESDGVGNIKIVKLKCVSAYMNQSGVGNMNVDNINAKYAECIMTGVGNMKLQGYVEKLNKRKNGVGKFTYKEIKK